MTGVGFGTGVADGFADGFVLADLLGVGVAEALVGAALVEGAALDELALEAVAVEAAALETAAPGAGLETSGAADPAEEATALAPPRALDGVPSGAA